MMPEYSLEQLGFRRGLTSTEYALLILDNLEKNAGDEKNFIEVYLEIVGKVLNERPSNAPSLNALRLIGEYLLSNGFDGVRDYISSLREKYTRACEDTARIASHRVVDGDIIMTMSNSMCLRSLFKILVDNGINYEVYVLESRPGMEGLVLADYLDKLGVKTYLIVDSASRFFMKNVKKIVIGVEALAVNGAIVGKIGTSLLSLNANEARVRVFALSPLYKLGFETIYGELLELPEGDWRYLMDESVRKTLPGEYRVRVPLFDATPPNLIDGIITEYGLFAPQAIPVILKQLYGKYPPEVRTIDNIVSEVKNRYSA
jgi:translation initiation factor 2B subunit (eIF-2B alpha/beta/delta family)